jgi:hypothetical protein
MVALGGRKKERKRKERKKEGRGGKKRRKKTEITVINILKRESQHSKWMKLLLVTSTIPKIFEALHRTTSETNSRPLDTWEFPWKLSGAGRKIYLIQNKLNDITLSCIRNPTENIETYWCKSTGRVFGKRTIPKDLIW